MQARFEQIYATSEWGSGSGEGSSQAHTRGYVRFLRRFLRVEGVRSVVDLGCGDWQFSRLIDWTGIQYDGFDIVPGLVEHNDRMFSAPNVRFHHFTTHWPDLPKADLLIVKDVLQHWSNGTIQDFLPTLAHYPSSLVTNCVDPSGKPTANQDCPDGWFRPLDIRLPPFGVQAKQVYSFTHARSIWERLHQPRWRKAVLLATR